MYIASKTVPDTVVTNMNVHSIVGSARDASSEIPPPAHSGRPTTPETQAILRRESQRQRARLDRDASPGIASSMNDTAKAQIESILGLSLSLDGPEHMTALRNALDTHINGLQDYVDLIKEYKGAPDGGRQPDDAISLLDGRFAPHMVAMENIRHPNLGLTHFDGLPQFIQHLQNHLDLGQPLSRRVMARSGIDADDTHHHLYIDITHKEGKLSLVVLDPSNLHSPEVMRAIAALNEALQDLQPQPYTWSYLTVNAQNSGNDCLHYVSSLAKKGGDDTPFMDSLHDKQRAGETLHRSEPEAYLTQMEEGIKERMQNVHQIVIDPNELLPLPFFKHVQPRQALDALLEVRPQDADKPVNKAKDRRPEQNIRERMEAHIPQEGRPRTGIKSLTRARTFYSVSIEEKRLTTAEKTLKLFKELRDTLTSAT